LFQVTFLPKAMKLPVFLWSSAKHSVNNG